MEENLFEIVYYDDDNIQHIAYTTETELKFYTDRYDKVEKNKN